MLVSGCSISTNGFIMTEPDPISPSATNFIVSLVIMILIESLNWDKSRTILENSEDGNDRVESYCNSSIFKKSASISINFREYSAIRSFLVSSNNKMMESGVLSAISVNVSVLLPQRRILLSEVRSIPNVTGWSHLYSWKASTPISKETNRTLESSTACAMIPSSLHWKLTNWTQSLKPSIILLKRDASSNFASNIFSLF
ncbi:hypothetical protein B6A09_1040 [Saccharomyces cerevisiae synthetic construct]|uniref:Putative uncharacterized protein YBR089W n=2 Tax=Saccharomyces cerevisiae TaxID=4932 RepID=YBT9_YEAST|nr:RecName: Full=Putative uncharacterized protein YBR089W [Saccharomyces cerevisiae S288C]ARB01883.1 hypothetical protein B6A09_1040 [Saccharomyces cerevisiae synthetic construct]WNV71979.1 hypothetical protein O6U65_0223 [Saccharomyces cerevisiae synthetic construct]CAA85039.1 unnamed protein product [Saccharomyces cerevisiae]CBK39164.1 EC1118_1B15_2322p [Saccharomyces cerevisiae EC1118]